jgi:hypothetical protein
MRNSNAFWGLLLSVVILQLASKVRVCNQSHNAAIMSIATDCSLLYRATAGSSDAHRNVAHAGCVFDNMACPMPHHPDNHNIL